MNSETFGRPIFTPSILTSGVALLASSVPALCPIGRVVTGEGR
jgi:hypothetical protein